MSATNTIVLTIAVASANVLGVAMLFPPALRLFRTGDLAGVSTAWIGASMAINVGWIVYGLEQSLWGLIPVSVGALSVYAAMAVRIGVIDREQALPLGLAVSALLAVLGWTMALVGPTAFGLVLAGAYCVQFAPAAITAVRSTSASGVSSATWAMALAEAVIWALYGLAARDAALVVGGVGASTMAIVVLTQARGTQVRDSLRCVSP